MDPRGSRAVLVLGHADTGRRAGERNRRRARAAVAVLRAGDVLICSGGAVVGPVPEARLLADAARALGWAGDLVLESASASTWENIERCAPLLAGYDRIAVVSEPVHAAKARSFLLTEHPDLAGRLELVDTAVLPSGGVRGTVAGLLDLWLSVHLDRWAQDSGRGRERLRRILASRS